MTRKYLDDQEIDDLIIKYVEARYPHLAQTADDFKNGDILGMAIKMEIYDDLYIEMSEKYGVAFDNELCSHYMMEIDPA